MPFQLRRRLRPGFIADARAGHARQLAAQSLGQAAISKTDLVQSSTDKIRHGDKVFAQRLGQAAHQGHAFGFQQPRHQPFQTLGRQLRQQRRRHAQGHAVTRVIGLEVISKRQAQFAQAQGIGVLRGGDFLGVAGQHVFFAHDQQVRVFCALALVPTVEAGALVDVGRQTRGVVSEQGFFIGEDVAAARLGFQLVEFLQQFAVGRQALGAGVDFPGHQPFADKQLTRGHRVNRAKMHGTAPDHDQAVEADLLIGHHLPTLLLPVRLEVVFLDQVAGQRLDPVRFDFGDHAREQLGGFHQLGGHQPGGFLAADHR